MIIEESKAAKMFCPMEMACDHDYRCQGSRCMAWRWAYDKVLKTADDPDAPVLEWFESVPSKTHGYCGLGGRP